MTKKEKRESFLEDLNRDFGSFRSDTLKWKIELEERQWWDVTLGDSEEFDECED